MPGLVRSCPVTKGLGVALTTMNAALALRLRASQGLLGFSTLLPSVLLIPLGWIMPRYTLVSFMCLSGFAEYDGVHWILMPVFLAGPTLFVIRFRRPAALVSTTA